MMEKLCSSLCNRWFLNSVNLKLSPALLLKTGFVLDPVISDTNYLQHSHRDAARPVLLAVYSFPESILAQLPQTVVAHTYDAQSKAIDFSRKNTEEVLHLFSVVDLVLWFFFVLISALFAVLIFFSCSVFQISYFILFHSKYFTGQKHFNCLELSSLLGSICMGI